MKYRDKFLPLTGLKGIFCFVIVFYHTLPTTPLIEKIPFTSFILTNGGTLGNFTFFMLSGFLISFGYRERIQKGLPFGDYLAKRLHKLYPAYIISCFVALLLQLKEYGPSAIKLKTVAFTVLLQAGGGLDCDPPYNSVAWFVSALFTCYVLYYVIAHYAKTPTQYHFALAIAITAGYTLLKKSYYFPFCYPANGQATLNFFIGCALAEVYPRIPQRMHRWLRPGSILVLLGSFYMMMRYGVEIICGDSCMAFAFMICPMILYISVESRIISPILRSNVMLYLGKISMSIFFWHASVYTGLLYLYRFFVPGAEVKEVTYIVYLIIMVAWSALFQFCLDHPEYLKRKKQVTRQNC